MKNKIFIALVTVLCCTQASFLTAANCNIDFTAYPTVNDGELQFDATVLDGDAPYAFTWNFGDDSFGNGQFITHSYTDPGVYEVCLSMMDNGSCSISVCKSIFVSSYPTGSLCYNNSDCVLPGDTDNDYDANVFDLLNIGVHYQEQGGARTNSSIEWEGQPSVDWSNSTFAGTNLKHIDCDGDGTISDADVDVIDYNYRILHENVSSSNGNPSNPTIRLEFDQDTVIIDPGNPGLVPVSLNIYFGDENIPMQNFYGFAMVLNYTEELIQPSSVEVIFDNDGFIGNENETLKLDNTSKPKYVDLARVRKTNTAVNGHGRVAKVDFTLIGNLIVERTSSQPTSTETKFQAGVREWEIIDQNGQPISVNIQNDEVVFKVTTSTTNIDGNTPINISPNPSKGNITVFYGNADMERIEIFSIEGRKIQSIESPNDQQTNISLDKHNNGIYFIRITTPYGNITRRVVIDK